MVTMDIFYCDEKTIFSGERTYLTVKIRVISLFLAIVLTILLIPAPVHADAAAASKEDRILQQIRQTYSDAQRGSGIYSFNGLCGTMVSWQTYLLGMDESMYAYDGNKAFDNYRWRDHSGGYHVESYPASKWSLRSALNAITQNGTRDAYNVLVGFQWTHTSAGSRFGHAVFIHGIIDGMVYFMESYNANIGGKYYREGEPIVCSIDTFCNYYSSWTALDGVINFGVKNYAALCESYPANMTAVAEKATFLYAEPAEREDSGKQTGSLSAGETVKVTRLYCTPGGSYWYELALDSEVSYVPAEVLTPVDVKISDIALEGLSIPGVIRKGAGAVLQGILRSRGGAMERLEVLVYVAGREELVLKAAVDVESATVRLSDKQIDRELSFRTLPLGTYDIVIRSKLENNVLEDGEPVRRTYWKTLWTAQVQIVSNWNKYATVTFAGNGGEAALNQTAVPNGACLQEFPTATREGYRFLGWSLRPDGSQPVDTATAIKGNTTLYAIWEQEEPAPDTDGGNEGNGSGSSNGGITNGRYYYLMRMARQCPFGRISMDPSVTSVRMVPTFGTGRPTALRITASGFEEYDAAHDWNSAQMCTIWTKPENLVPAASSLTMWNLAVTMTAGCV